MVSALDRRYPRDWAESWDRVGLVLGDFEHPVRRILCVVDCVPETVDQALAERADLIVAHHPLLLKPVSSIAPDTYKGRIIHRLIRQDIALYCAHTNADVASPGVSDALAARLGLRDMRPLVPATGAAAGAGRGIGRIGELAEPMDLAEFTGYAATRLPTTAAGVRAAGDPSRVLRTIAVCGGAGDSFLTDATRAGVDAYLCADLRHHPASEHLAEDGPALLDVAHWATERPWLDDVAAWLRADSGAEVIVSDVDTDPWTVHARDIPETKEPLL
ncbi:Nif3-like dinuclear metal center hexameric protein [Actinoplanes sp. TRM 88003]|uniref:GTP cyclohydrolase 1 type 2 homolog n=1 Tax=Paractinoplanes aksuensis TaxID=2939490 RepID=A0ABT1DXN5_9ACTN|nr:Nif3-like dinuclear metal center hexameric protein [Actinoplanes aksuensis]MCO8274806.1 Nif3-like dinuclear metal center hexameric protein [Actinoplanes aksuensis]